MQGADAISSTGYDPLIIDFISCLTDIFFYGKSVTLSDKDNNEAYYVFLMSTLMTLNQPIGRVRQIFLAFKLLKKTFTRRRQNHFTDNI